MTNRNQRRLLFLDVDGVLLDYQTRMIHFLRAKGYQVPEDYRDRVDSYYPAGLVGKEEEASLVNEFGMTGNLAELEPYSDINRGQMAFILNNPNTYILSTFKEAFRADRYIGLSKAFGPFSASKILSSFGVSKGQVLKDVCERDGVQTSDALLVDDLTYNLDSAAAVGAKTLLVSHKYNSGDFLKFRPFTDFAKLTENLASFLVGVGNGK